MKLLENRNGAHVLINKTLEKSQSSAGMDISRHFSCDSKKSPLPIKGQRGSIIPVFRRFESLVRSFYCLLLFLFSFSFSSNFRHFRHFRTL